MGTHVDYWEARAVGVEIHDLIGVEMSFRPGPDQHEIQRLYDRVLPVLQTGMDTADRPLSWDEINDREAEVANALALMAWNLSFSECLRQISDVPSKGKVLPAFEPPPNEIKRLVAPSIHRP